MISNLLKGGKRRNLYYRNTRAEFQNLEPAERSTCGKPLRLSFLLCLLSSGCSWAWRWQGNEHFLACLVCYILRLVISTYNVFSMEEVAWNFPIHSEGDQPRDFFGRHDAKAETPVLWPPHAKSRLVGKDSDCRGVRVWSEFSTR